MVRGRGGCGWVFNGVSVCGRVCGVCVWGRTGCGGEGEGSGESVGCVRECVRVRSAAWRVASACAAKSCVCEGVESVGGCVGGVIVCVSVCARVCGACEGV